MLIERIDLDQLGSIIAQLVQQGLTFKAFPEGDGRWMIELTGGY